LRKDSFDKKLAFLLEFHVNSMENKPNSQVTHYQNENSKPAENSAGFLL
jgi:hypothetical protein